MAEGAEGLLVEFVAIGGAVKATGHEMDATIFFEKAAVAHRDASGTGHEAVGIFNATVAEGIGEFFVGIAIDTIELDEPGFEASWKRDLAGTDFAGLGIPSHDRFGTGSPGRGSDAKDVGERFYAHIDPKITFLSTFTPIQSKSE